jgi:phosphoribosylglycinamide formyltransferase 1
MSSSARLVVLISGFGSNLQAILDAVRDGTLPAQVCAVVCNKAGAYGLDRARAAGVPAVIHSFIKGQERSEYDRQMAEIVASFQPDWVILAGWMRILTGAFLQRFPNRVVNLHPALPGTFPGTHAIERAFEAYQAGQIDATGVMVHLVPDEGVDCGPVLSQVRIPILTSDTLDTLEARIHTVEHELLINTLKDVMTKDLPNRHSSI